MRDYFEKIFVNGRLAFEEKLRKSLENEEKLFVVTANPETLMTGQSDSEYDNLLKDSDTCIVPDGIGIVKAANILGYSVKERVTGVELCQFLLEESARQKKSVFLFGSREEVVSVLAEKVKKEYPELLLAGYENGYVTDKDAVFERIAGLKPDVVLVALGIPQQELLIYRHLPKFQKGVFIGVGGSFDVLSGMKKRAPQIFIKLNLEWLYRIMNEPQRIGRFYKSNVKFISLIRRIR